MGLFSSIGTLAGSYFGPWGSAVGGAIGGAIDSNKSRKADKQSIQKILGIIENGRQAELEALRNGDQEAMDAIRQSVADQLAVFDQIIDEQFPERVAALREIFKPYRAVGVSALDQQAAMLGIPDSTGKVNAFDPNYITSRPSYKFVQEQGNRAVDRSAAARTGTLGGRAVKEGQRFASGLASQEFNNEFSRLGTLSTMGANASANLAGQVNNAYNDLTRVMLGKAGVIGSEGANLAEIALNTAYKEIGINRNANDNLISLEDANAASKKNQLAREDVIGNNLLDILTPGVGKRGSVSTPDVWTEVPNTAETNWGRPWFNL